MNIDAWQWQREHKKKKKNRFLPVHTYPKTKTDILFLSLAYHQHVSGKNGHPKRIFSKTLSRVEIFENAGFSFRFGRTKPEVFEYDDVIHHILLAWRMYRKWCYRISIVLAFSCERTKTIRIRYVWTRIFFENGEKISVFKNIWLRVDRALRWCYTIQFATTIFSATQRCNIVMRLFRIVTTLFQYCNAVLR